LEQQQELEQVHWLQGQPLEQQQELVHKPPG
jgi:hypothetical protein